MRDVGLAVPVVVVVVVDEQPARSSVNGESPAMVPKAGRSPDASQSAT